MGEEEKEQEPESGQAGEEPKLSLDRLLALKLPFQVVLAEKEVRVEDVLALRPGDVLEFNKHVDDPLQVTVGRRPVGTGVAVKSGENFGMRIHKILSPEETIRMLGGSE